VLAFLPLVYSVVVAAALLLLLDCSAHPPALFIPGPN
jgi:hypothetical protein